MKIITAIIFFLFSSSAHAEKVDAAFYGKPPADFDVSKYTRQIAAIEEYLSGFSDMYTRFIQNDDDGILKKGYLYIARPGKARWEYKTPVQTLLVVRNNRIMYYDKELEQVSYDDLPNIPLKILLNKSVRLSGDVKVIDYHESEGTVYITLVSANEDNDDIAVGEKLSLVFEKDPLKLIRIYRADPMNHTSTLELINLQFDKNPDDELFSLADPTFLNKKGKK